MTRYEVPGGGWFDLKGPGDLTEDHQNQFLDLVDELKNRKRQALATVFATANPGMVPGAADETPVELTLAEERPLRDLVLSWTLEGSSYGVPLPYPLPLLASNVLRLRLGPTYRALHGLIPKESLDSDSPSTPTSPAPAPPALPESAPAQ